MKTTTLDKLIWILIYGGLLGVCLGFSVQRSDAALGYAVIAAGSVTAVSGFALIYVRSRVKDVPPPSDKTPS